MASRLPTGDDETVYRIVLCGDSGVGKSCLMYRFMDNTYTDNNFATIGVDFNIRHVELQGHRVRLQIWDTAGQERFRSVSKAYFRLGDGVILVYDVTNKETFDNLPDWLRQLDACGCENKQRLLVGSKSDLDDDRVVSYEMAKEFADKLHMPYMETSAKNDANVGKAFMTLASQLLKHQPPARASTGKGTVKLSGRGNGSHSSSCCGNCTPDKKPRDVTITSPNTNL